MPKDYGNNKTERNEAHRLGAVSHPNSGRGLIKGDSHDSLCLIDVKEAAKSFTLNEKVWLKVSTDAYKYDASLYPAVLLVLGVDRPKRLMIIDANLYVKMRDAYEKVL
jgi:hypothetical protein